MSHPVGNSEDQFSCIEAHINTNMNIHNQIRYTAYLVPRMSAIGGLNTVFSSPA